MKIDCYVSLSCVSESTLRDNVRQALAMEAAEAKVSFHKIGEEEAESLGLKGSPSVLVNGRDILPGEIAGFS